VAFVRNVMVGRGELSREQLVDAFVDAGATDVTSILGTGNVVFAARPDDAAGIAAEVERLLAERVGLHEPILVRSMAELGSLVDRDPFASMAAPDVHERMVTLLPDDSPALPDPPISSPRGDVEIFAAGPREVLAITRSIGGRTANPGALVERLTGVKVTTRNFNTIVRIVERNV
jgi:uncharacterized protein (DUF1697 family)